VNLLDLYPSLIELCGLPAKQLDGKSFKPLLENPTLPWTPAVTTLGKGNHSVISEKWHYIAYDDGVEELYDLEKDPMEWTNLARASAPELAQAKTYLRSFLPKNEVDSLPKSKGEKNRGKIDLTIKATRNLATLK
jgi:arylsulfatase A-like enzyme